MDPSVRVKVIPRGIKFKDTPAESSKVHRKHSTSDGSSSNPVALFYKKLACVETRIINQLKRPEELDTSEEETDGLDDKGSEKQDQQRMKKRKSKTPPTALDHTFETHAAQWTSSVGGGVRSSFWL
ncbi:hypothetical protein PIB30_088153 [Stylosanthes scabra]|uniref:Uncharacterized protein n=1 Tax=Stylosanthes scabra TaxID=79078 RepID=A0ABU6QV16_9FABA|nr:hypothetical protein [Stylosanthes scabra]